MIVTGVSYKENNMINLNNTYFRVEDDKLVKLCLDECERQGLVWWAGQEKPTERARSTWGDYYDIILIEEGCGLMTADFTCIGGGDYKELTFADFNTWTRESTAVSTLEGMGYTWNGGKLWKPPLGNVPEYITEQTKTIYVPCDESIFDLKQDFENGLLYKYHRKDDWFEKIKSEKDLVSGYIFKTTEIDFTWHDYVKEFIEGQDAISLDHSISNATQLPSNEDHERWDDEFIKLCHLVARLTDEPE